MICPVCGLRFIYNECFEHRQCGTVIEATGDAQYSCLCGWTPSARIRSPETARELFDHMNSHTKLDWQRIITRKELESM